MSDQVAPDLSARITASESGTVDDKNRITLSVNKRLRLGNPFTLLLGRRNCLEAYPRDVWAEKCAEIDKFGLINDGAEDYARLIYGNAQENIKWDSQGRFVLPSNLRRLASIDKDVELIGMGRYLEIWAKEEYEKFQKSPKTYEPERCELFKTAYRSMIGRDL